MQYTSTDYKRFLASAPQAQREYRTIELYHPAFGTYRFVEDTEDQVLSSMTFTAISMRITEPNENKDAETALTVQLGGVGGEVQAVIDAMSGTDFLTPISCTYRKWYSGDISSPVLTLSLSVSNVDFNSYTSVSFTAEDVDFANKKSGEIYTIARFPMLAGI